MAGVVQPHLRSPAEAVPPSDGEGARPVERRLDVFLAVGDRNLVTEEVHDVERRPGHRLRRLRAVGAPRESLLVEQRQLREVVGVGVTYDGGVHRRGVEREREVVPPHLRLAEQAGIQHDPFRPGVEEVVAPEYGPLRPATEDVGPPLPLGGGGEAAPALLDAGLHRLRVPVRGQRGDIPEQGERLLVPGAGAGFVPPCRSRLRLADEPVGVSIALLGRGGGGGGLRRGEQGKGRGGEEDRRGARTWKKPASCHTRSLKFRGAAGAGAPDGAPEGTARRIQETTRNPSNSPRYGSSCAWNSSTTASGGP